MFWVNLIPILLIALVLVALPSLSRPTVPLGVSVPTTRLNEPVVHRSLRRYRIGVLACGVAVAAVVVLLTPGAATVADDAAPFVLLAAAGAVFAWARRPILQAKKADGWYDGLPVRIIARLTDEPRRVSGQLAWYAVSVAVVAAGAIAGGVFYDRQPDPYPTHWDLSGAADSTSAKTPLAVFAPLAVILGVVVFMAVIGALVARLPERRYADGDPAGAERRRVAVQASVQSGLGLLTLLVAAGVLILVVRFARAGAAPANSGGTTPDTTGPQSPDDDSHWRAGLFYVNPDDPSILVPKRLGIGWTINFGRPAGVVIAVLTLLLIAGVILVGLLQQH